MREIIGSFFCSIRRMETVLTPIEQYVVDFVFKLRREKNLTQSDIGVVIGTKTTFVHNVENLQNRAKYNLNHINALADHFNISICDFFPKKAFPVQDKNNK